MTRRIVSSALAGMGALLAAIGAFLCVAVFAPASALLYDAPGAALAWMALTLVCMVACVSLLCGPCLHLHDEPETEGTVTR